MTKSETSATSRKLPIKPEKDETHTDMQFMKQNLDSKVEKLKALFKIWQNIYRWDSENNR